MQPRRHGCLFKKEFEAANSFGSGDIPGSRVLILLAVRQVIFNDRFLRPGIQWIASGEPASPSWRKYISHAASRDKSADRRPSIGMVYPNFRELSEADLREARTKFVEVGHRILDLVDDQLHAPVFLSVNTDN